MAKAHALAGTLDKTGDICHNKRLTVVYLHNAKNRSQGREVIVCDLGLCGRNDRNKGRFSHIWKTYKTHISYKL